MTERNINVDDLRQHLKDTGQTFDLMKRLAGIAEGNGKDHSQPCPHCGGTDRFWYSVDYERCYCRKCNPNGKGYDIFALVQHHQGIGFKDALQLVARESGFIADCVNDKSPTKTTPTKKPQRYNERKTSHVYHDADGKEVYRIIRTDYTDESGKPGKTFCPAFGCQPPLVKLHSNNRQFFPLRQ